MNKKDDFNDFVCEKYFAIILLVNNYTFIIQ